MGWGSYRNKDWGNVKTMLISTITTEGRHIHGIKHSEVTFKDFIICVSFLLNNLHVIQSHFGCFFIASIIILRKESTYEQNPN